eukprot:6904588-Pyramimonas_sp.AAC.1
MRGVRSTVGREEARSDSALRSGEGLPARHEEDRGRFSRRTVSYLDEHGFRQHGGSSQESGQSSSDILRARAAGVARGHGGLEVPKAGAQ